MKYKNYNMDNINTRHYSISKATTGGIILFKESVYRYFSNFKLKNVGVKTKNTPFKNQICINSFVNGMLDYQNKNVSKEEEMTRDELIRGITKFNKMEYSITDYYLKQTLPNIETTIRFYRQSNLPLIKLKESSINEIYYTFYNRRSIAEIKLDVKNDDISQLVTSRTNTLIRNLHKDTTRIAKVLKSYYLADIVPNLYMIVRIDTGFKSKDKSQTKFNKFNVSLDTDSNKSINKCDNQIIESYLVEYSLIGIHFLEELINTLDELKDGWCNYDAYLIPFYKYIQKYFKRHFTNGVIGIYKSKIYPIKDGIKMPSKMTTNYVSEVDNNEPDINDYYITNSFIKLVKSTYNKPLCDDDELLKMFDEIPKQNKKTKKKKKKNVEIIRNDKCNEEYITTEPKFIPTELNITDDSDSNSDNSDSDVNSDNNYDNEIETIDNSYHNINKTYNNKYTFDVENDILMNNYYNNPKIYQMLNEIDEIIFIKPIVKHYKTNYRYFNIMLKINNITTNQYHIHLNMDDRIYSITMIKNLLD